MFVVIEEITTLSFQELLPAKVGCGGNILYNANIKIHNHFKKSVEGYKISNVVDLFLRGFFDVYIPAF